MSEEGYKPNAGMKAAAKAALEWHKQGKRGGTAVGLARANQIVNGETLSASTVKRMFSFFSRHEVDKKAKGFSPGEEGYPSPGRVAWNLWGGDAGFAFARGHVKSMKKSLYDNILEKTDELVEIIEKTWTPNPGTLSPFSSSSSQHSEESDNHLEYYVKESPDSISPDISSMFNSDLFTNGGDKMTEKTLDVSSSTEVDSSYTNPGSSTTEPDPQSQIAITKAEVPMGSQDLEGKGTFSTTANTTEQAPPAGDTTEPMEKAANNCPSCGGDCCADCGKSMKLCNCMGMNKAAAKSDDDEDADSEPDDDEDDLMEKKEFSTARRKQLAHAGKAMADGSYPIENEQDLKNAIRSWGRGGSDPKVKQHIISRAKALGKQSVLPEDWTKDMKKSIWGNAFLPVD